VNIWFGNFPQLTSLQKAIHGLAGDGKAMAASPNLPVAVGGKAGDG
jgi:hypothetical protein